jgi:type II secretory pathway component PulF
MQLYHWRARTSTGRACEGEFLAGDEQEVAAFVRTNFGYVTGIKLIKQKRSLQSLLFKSRRIRDRERALFFKHLHILLRSGIPLLQALKLLQDKLGPRMAKVNEHLCRELTRGQSLAAALERQPQVFPQLAVAAVEAGELSGNLTEVLEALQQYYAKQAELRRFVVNACLYPLLLLLFSCGTLVFFIFKVLPLFGEMYVAFRTEQSWGLQLLLESRMFLLEHYLGAAVLGAGASLILWRQRRWLRRFLPLMPGYQRLQTKYLEIRFSKLLSLLLRSGVNLPQAITVAGKAVGDDEHTRKCGIFADSVIRGIGVEQAAALSGRLFSETGMAFLKVGENSGTLPEMLAQSAAIQEQELRAEISNLKTLLEPLLIVVVAGVILLLVMSVLGPMFTLINQLPEY